MVVSSSGCGEITRMSTLNRSSDPGLSGCCDISGRPKAVTASRAVSVKRKVRIGLKYGGLMKRALFCVCVILACTANPEGKNAVESSAATPAQADRPIAIVHDGLASAEAVSFDAARDV